MLLRRRAFATVAGLVLACGARTDPSAPRPYTRIAAGDLLTADEIPCLGDLDCVLEDRCFPRTCVEQRCVDLAPIVCEDTDPCTEDACDPETGDCTFRALSLDEDGDGFRGPRPGYSPGAPGSCGDDCDDTSADAYPGGIERCDGVDNDCNGIVDENASYLPVSEAPVLVPDEADEASVAGIAFTGENYAASFSAQRGAWQTSIEMLSPSGQTAVPEQGVTSVNADTFAGPVVWTGSQIATAWEDRRDGDFEIYFNRLDREGNKLGPDVRITNAPEFSLRPDLVWDGAEFVVVWGDRRNDPDDYQIFGQRVGSDGVLLGDNVVLTPPGLDAEAPKIAEGTSTLGLVFNVTSPEGRRVAFRTMSHDLATFGELRTLGGPGSVGATIVWSGDRYVVAWSLRDVTPGPSIFAMTLGEDGEIKTPETAITGPAAFARAQAMLPLGDRLLIVWAEEGSDGYELYTKQITLDLRELSPAVRVTTSPLDATAPAIAFGPDGDVGILYEDLQSGTWQVYFARLSCRPGGI
jgi:hypothetical protein